MNIGNTGNQITSRVKFVIKLSFIAALACMLIFVGYSYFLITKMTSVNQLRINNKITTAQKNISIRLEKDSVFQGDDLKFLFPFLEKERNFSKWLKQELDSGHLVDLSYMNMSGYFEVHKEFKFNLNKVNDCEKIYCYQQRLDFKDIPSNLWRGLIGVEDNRFLDHQGVDPRGILRAVLVAIKSGHLKQGGSTLTQQLVKNLFFTQERTLKRKINEMIVSLYIETIFSKEEILQSYFNEVIWGSLGGIRLKGIYSASLFYFAKKPFLLDAYESSILSALLKGPYYFHPLKNIEKLKARAKMVYEILKNKKYISKFDESEWNNEKWAQWKSYLEKRQNNTRLRAFTLALNTLDFYEQYVFSTISQDFLKTLKKRLPNKDLAIKMIYRDFESCEEGNCPDISFYSKAERDTWKGINSEKHQVGSLLKPFVYQAAFNGYSSGDDRIETDKIEISLPSGIWSPKDHRFDEPMITLSESLQKSRNTTFIRMARQYGFKELEKYLTEFFPDLKSPLGEYPAQLLGSYEASLMELLRSYSTLFQNQCGKPMDAKNVLNILSDPNLTTISKRVGPYLEQQLFFGKTGTSNKSFDNWFVGLNQGKILVIWTGLEGSRESGELNLAGSSTSFKLYEQFKLRSGHKMGRSICGDMFLVE